MAARPRSHARKGWPANLYAKERNGPYYFWRHPGTGSEYGLGRNFNEARIQALEANIKLAGMSASRRLIDRISDEGAGTVSEFAPIYRQIVEARGVKTNTLKAMNACLRKIEAGIGDMIMRRVTTEDMNDKVMEPLYREKKLRFAKQVHTHLMDLWKEAAGKGKVESNPADLLRLPEVKVKRQRWTLETFMKTYAAAQTMPDRWVARCMKLALVSAQPRECLVAFEFSDAKDGFLWNERGKTGARVKLPLSLTLPGVGWKLEDVIKECRDDVLSRYMLHHNVRRTMADPGDPIALNGASKGIQRARERTDLTWPEGTLPPTLHEIRSLSLRIYREAYGRDFAQALAAHKEGTTTDLYTDSRGSDWIEVKSS